MRTLVLGIALAPYLLIAGVDAWMHEAGRKVPRVEQALHASLALAMILFLAAAFLQRTAIAVAALSAFLVLLVWDELGYHAAIAASERRIHRASWLALACFVGAWLLVDA